MVANDAEQWVRFREEIWKFLQKKTRGGSGEILRIEVEVIGATLGLSGDEACREFLSLRGNLWDVRGGDLFASMIPSAKGEDSPRNWFAFANVCLL